MQQQVFSRVALSSALLIWTCCASAAEPSVAPTIPEWLSRLSWSGDLRYRIQRVDDETATDIRQRDRARARLNLSAKVVDDVTATFGVTTTENGDPRSGNQTFDQESSRKSLYIDLMYFDWALAKPVHLLGGKMKMPFFRPGQSLFYDSDINPEGFAFSYNQGPWFGSAYRYWVDENVISTGTTASNADTMHHGLQIGRSFALGKSKLTVAAMYTDLSKAKDYRPFFNNTATGQNGNTVTGTGTAAVLTYDFNVAELAAQWDAKIGDLPLQVWANVAKNLDPDDLNQAWTAGVLVGKASAAHTWEAGLSLQKFEKDALFGQFIDSDFYGSTDSSATIVRGAYAVKKNVTVNLTHFWSKRNIDVGTSSHYNTLLAELNFKF